MTGRASGLGGRFRRRFVLAFDRNLKVMKTRKTETVMYGKTISMARRLIFVTKTD